METSLSLLDSLKLPEREAAWSRLVEIYTPLMRGWMLRHGMKGTDADDVVQDVLTVVLRRVPEFERQRTGSFRSWLRTITVNCLRDFRKKQNKGDRGAGDSDVQNMLNQLSDPNSGVSRLWEAEHDQHVFKSLLDTIRGEFSETTWTAFRRVGMEGARAEDVAEELEITKNAVFIAKSRVLSRLRQLGQGLIE